MHEAMEQLIAEGLDANYERILQDTAGRQTRNLKPMTL